MSRAANALGMLDIRSAAILQDVIYASDPCAPGNSPARNLYHRYGDSIMETDAPASVSSGGEEAGAPRHKKFDGSKDWIAAFSSMVIAGTIIGILQSYAILIPYIIGLYKIGMVATVMTGVSAYAMLILFGPFASCLVGWMGVRLTCVFGMLLFFLGLVLTALNIHRAVFYISYIMLLGLGGSLAYTAAVSSVVDRFRRSLPLALLILSLCSPVGTAAYYGLLYLILSSGIADAFEWAVLSLAVIVLILIFTTYVFPTRLTAHHPDPFGVHLARGNKVKHCVAETAKKERNEEVVDAAHPQQRSILFVVVIDISILTDLSFVLWAAITFLAMLSFFLPYIFLLIFAFVYGISADPPVVLMFWFCLGSILGRVATVLGNDHTFLYNRVVFQTCVIGSGLLYIVILSADTYGWILVWAIIVGVLEGVLTTVMPRVAMQTIPRKWMSSSWAYIVLVNALSIAAGVAVVICTLTSSKNFKQGFVVIGMAQILAGLLAFLLPSEEDNESLPMVPAINMNYLAETGTQSMSYSKDVSYTRTETGFGGNSYSVGKTSTYDSASSYLTNKGFGAGRSTGIGNTYPGLGCDSKRTYCADCPICSKIGCVPGCCPCTPGGLTSSLPMPSCLDPCASVPQTPCCSSNVNLDESVQYLAMGSTIPPVLAALSSTSSIPFLSKFPAVEKSKVNIKMSPKKK